MYARSETRETQGSVGDGFGPSLGPQGGRRVGNGGKRFKEAYAAVDRDHLYSPREAIKLLKQLPDAKFDETIELSIRLGVDPRKADQMVRGAVSLPKGTGKTMRVAVFAKGE